MAGLEYKNYAGFGEFAAANLLYSSTVRIGDTIHASGQGGWDPTRPEQLTFPEDLSEEIEQAFKNVELALKEHGASWKNVYKVRSYHAQWNNDAVGSDGRDIHTMSMVDNYRKYCPDHKPTWTEVGVARLGLQRMRIEIEVEAYIGK